MKNKILYLLIFTLVFNAVALFPHNYVAYAADNYLNNSQTLLGELNITDSSFNLTDADNITRSQFAVYLAKVLGIKPDGSKYYADVEDGSVIHTLAKLGYVTGNGQNYKPDDFILFDDALKYMLLSLGYKPYFDANGDSAAICANLAKKAKLADTSYLGTYISGTQLQGLLNNMLFADRMIPDGYNGKNNYYIDSDNPLIKDVFHAESVTDIVTANEYVSLYTNVSSVEKGKIRIGNKIFKTDVLNANDYIGVVVEAYYFEKNNGGQPRIFAMFESEDNSSVTITSDKIENIDRNKITYYDDNDKKQDVVINDAYVIYNGDAKTETTFNEISALLKKDNTKITVYKATSYFNNRPIIVEDTYLIGTVYNVDLRNDVISVDYNDGTQSYNISDADFFEIYNAHNNFETISANGVHNNALVCVSASDKKNIVKICVCTDSVSGAITNTDYEGNETVVTINDVKYTVNKQNLINAKDLLGKKGTFYIDIFGKIAYAENISDADLVYAYIYAGGVEGTMSTAYKYKFIDENGQHIIGTLADKVKLDGEKQSAKYVDSVLSPDGTVTRQLVRLRVNESGEIKEIDTAANNADGNDTLFLLADREYRKYHTCKKTGARNFWEDGSNIRNVNSYPLSSNIMEFTVPPISKYDYEEKDFAAKKGVSFMSGDDEHEYWYWVTLYKVRGESDFADVVVYEKDSKRSCKTSDYCYLVNKTYTTVDSDGAETSVLQTICTNLKLNTDNLIMGDTVNILIKNGLYGKDGITVTVPGIDVPKYISSGDIIQYGSSTDSKIYDIQLIMDYSDGSPKALWGYDNVNGEEKYSYKYESISDEEYNALTNNDDKAKFVYGYVNDLYLTSKPHQTSLEAPVRSVLWLSDIETGEVRSVFTLDTQNQFWTMYDSKARNAKAICENLDNISTQKNAGDSATKVFVMFASDGITPQCLVFYK